MAKKNNKTTKVQEFRALSESELKAKVEEQTLRMRKMQFSHAITPIENPMSIRMARREIAQLQTEIKRKQSGF